MKKRKQAYYDKYFERNWNNNKNIRKRIKFLISLKTVASQVPTVLSLDNGDTITNPYVTAKPLMISELKTEYSVFELNIHSYSAVD